MNVKTLNEEFVKLLAKQNSNLRDILPRFKMLPVRNFLKRDGSSTNPHVSAVLYAEQNKLRLCAGYVVYKPRSEQYWMVDIHSFVLDKNDKVIETTKLYDQKQNIVHYIGIVIPESDYKTYLDKIGRLDYVKKHSPVTTFKRG